MLTDIVKQSIQEAYRRFLASRGWQARQGQKQMIADIARCVGRVVLDGEGRRQGGDSHICVVEAGTGTGKTIAYCLAAIPLAKALDKTLVISTATVALQEQIIFKDLPDLRRYSELPFEFALAKGRARYLCPAKLDAQLEGSLGENAGMSLYLGEGASDDVPVATSEVTLKLFQDFLNAMASGEWEGDRDAWPKHIDTADWVKVTTDHHQCAGRRCAYIAQCPFFRARDRINGVDVVVANHDLVLADISLGGGAILPEPEQCIYVFDEAHHLADKAINHFAFHTRVDSSKKWLKQVEKNMQSLGKALGSMGTVQTCLEKIAALLENLHATTVMLLDFLAQEISFPEGPNDRPFNKTRRHRFVQGLVPEPLREYAQVLMEHYLQLSMALADVEEQLKSALDSDSPAAPRHEVELWYPLVGALQGRADSSYELWRSYAKADTGKTPPRARWITLRDDNTAIGGIDFEVCSSPIQSATMLEETLWNRCFAAVLTSATLTALNSFDRFRWRSGTPIDAHYVSIPSPFRFQDSLLCVPALLAEPSNTLAHTDEVITFVRNTLLAQGNSLQNNEAEGMLVLFSSRRQMEDVYDGLEKNWQEGILMQGDLSKQEMISEHKKRIDSGQHAVLFGLASFAEGVDLPGNYCTHVVIAKLPFAVPDDPVEEALAEWVEKNGGNAFMDITVPDASLKLVQACGRLLRHERDRGRITLLDRRVVTKRYGKTLLDSLPPYQRVIEK